MRNDESGSGHRGSYGRGTGLVQLQARDHLRVHRPGRSERKDGREDAGSVRDVPEERERLDVEKGCQTGHHP